MATSTLLIVIFGMAIVTYVTRLPLYFLTVRRYELPRLLDLILKRIPAAAFAAIVFPGVFQPGGTTDLRTSNFYLYAAAAAMAAALLLRRSLLWTILIGVGTATLLRVVFG